MPIEVQGKLNLPPKTLKEPTEKEPEVVIQSDVTSIFGARQLGKREVNSNFGVNNLGVGVPVPRTGVGESESVEGLLGVFSEGGTIRLDGTGILLEKVGDSDVEIYAVNTDGNRRKLEGAEREAAGREVHNKLYAFWRQLRKESDGVKGEPKTNMDDLEMIESINRVIPFIVKRAESPTGKIDGVWGGKGKDEDARSNLGGLNVLEGKGDEVLCYIAGDKSTTYELNSDGTVRKIQDVETLKQIADNIQEFMKTATPERTNLTLDELQGIYTTFDKQIKELEKAHKQTQELEKALEFASLAAAALVIKQEKEVREEKENKTKLKQETERREKKEEEESILRVLYEKPDYMLSMPPREREILEAGGMLILFRSRHPEFQQAA